MDGCLIHDDTTLSPRSRFILFTPFFVCEIRQKMKKKRIWKKKKRKKKPEHIYIWGWIGAHFWHHWFVTVDRQAGKPAVRLFLVFSHAREEDASESKVIDHWYDPTEQYKYDRRRAQRGIVMQVGTRVHSCWGSNTRRSNAICNPVVYCSFFFFFLNVHIGLYKMDVVALFLLLFSLQALKCFKSSKGFKSDGASTEAAVT